MRFCAAAKPRLAAPLSSCARMSFMASDVPSVSGAGSVAGILERPAQYNRARRTGFPAHPSQPVRAKGESMFGKFANLFAHPGQPDCNFSAAC
jgi:hypothetical protein